jgi:Mg-chelatase subunit ChlD
MARDHSQENSRLWAAGSKLLESPAVRVRFALFALLLANAASCARAGGAVQGDGAVDRPTATEADVPGSPAGLRCTVDAAVNLNLSVVDILILLDGSESMGIGFGSGTRYSVVGDVLANLADAYQSRIRFGFAKFPEADALCSGVAGCCAGPPSVGVAGGNGTAVKEALANMLPPAGNTPTARALQRAHDYYAGLADGVTERYVLLATDGLPSCTLSGGLSSTQPANADGGLSDACQDALDQVQAMAGDGIKVVVLEVGAEPNDDPEEPRDCLNLMAQAGGMPYYSAASPETLQAAIEKIFGGVHPPPCSLVLDPAPTAPELVSVYLDNQEIPYNSANGWVFDSAGDAGDSRRITIVGEYCKRIEQSRYSSIEARYGCKPCSNPGTCT